MSSQRLRPGSPHGCTARDRRASPPAESRADDPRCRRSLCGNSPPRTTHHELPDRREEPELEQGDRSLHRRIEVHDDAVGALQSVELPGDSGFEMDCAQDASQSPRSGLRNTSGRSSRAQITSRCHSLAPPISMDLARTMPGASHGKTRGSAAWSTWFREAGSIVMTEGRRAFRGGVTCTRTPEPSGHAKTIAFGEFGRLFWGVLAASTAPSGAPAELPILAPAVPGSPGTSLAMTHGTLSFGPAQALPGLPRFRSSEPSLKPVRVPIRTVLLFDGLLSPAATPEPMLAPTATLVPRAAEVAPGALGGLGRGYTGTVVGRQACGRLERQSGSRVWIRMHGSRGGHVETIASTRWGR